jgi:putative transposase
MDAFERWGLDYVSMPTTSSGNKKILTAIDYCTGQGLAEPCTSESAQMVIEFLERLMCQYGKPSSLIMDNGGPFSAATLRAWARVLGIRIIHAAPYRPQTNGKVERFNGTFVRLLKRMAFESDVEWDDAHVFGQALFAYRTARSSPSGQSPFS